MQVLDDIEFDEKLRIRKVVEGWLWNENLLYDVFSSHILTANRIMGCSFRTGQGRIEYNAKFTRRHDDKQLAELLKIEVMRIILKHPYTRRQEGIRDDASVCASDVTIVQNCRIGDVGSNEIMTAETFNIPKGYCYEEYCKILTQLFSTLPPSESVEMSKINGPSVDNEHPSDQNDSNDNSQYNKNEATNSTENAQNQQCSGTQSPENQLQEMSDNAKERAELWEEDPVVEEILQEKIETILLVGNPGCGKSLFCRQLRELFRQNYDIFIPLGAGQGSDAIAGSTPDYKNASNGRILSSI